MTAASLERFLPRWEFDEHHEISVDASPEEVDRALRELTLGDLPLARVLVWLRFLPSRRARATLDPRKPIVDVFTGGSVLLKDAPREEIVYGVTGDFAAVTNRVPKATTPEEFDAYDRADACKAVMNFRIEPLDGGTLLTTDTRVHAGDRVRRKFTAYWRVVRPFSGLIRILILRAAKRRAESRT